MHIRFRRVANPTDDARARYEMLFVIANTNMWLEKVHFVLQSDIRRQLGVSAVASSAVRSSSERVARHFPPPAIHVWMQLTSPFESGDWFSGMRVPH